MSIVPNLSEPAIGTVVFFSYELIGGGVESVGMLVRTPAGWSATPDGANPVTWASLTDEERFSSDPAARSFRALQVTVVARPVPKVVGRLMQTLQDVKDLRQEATDVDFDALIANLSGVVDELAAAESGNQ